MSVTATSSLLPVREIMSSSASSLSPAKNKKSSRTRLSELLKPSSQTSRDASPAHPPAGNAALPLKSTDSTAAWPLVTSSKNEKNSGKSKENAVEVVIGTSPVRTSNSSPVHTLQDKPLSKSQPSTITNSVPIPASSLPSTKTETQSKPAGNKSLPLRRVRSGSEKKMEVTTTVKETPSELQRSASDINLVDLRARSDTTGSQASSRPSIRSAVSETGLVVMHGSTVLERPQATASISRETRISRRQSITNRLRGRQQLPEPLPVGGDSMPQIAELPKAMLSPRDQVPDPMDEKASTLTKVARRTSWIIGSRSPSPSNKKLRQKKSVEARLNSSSKTDLTSSGSSTKLPRSVSASDVSQTAAGSKTTKTTTAAQGDASPNVKSRRPLSAILTRSSSFVSGQKPNINLPKSLSAERLPISPRAVDEVPEMPKSIPKSKLPSGLPDTPRKKDELWVAFRNLDAEFHKFSSKPSSLKAQVIRSSLLPFLKQFPDHPSTKNLRADDLDKRINVFNKWWVGLLEMLNGRNGQSVSPNDRPAVLEGVAGIMTRPEWRLSLSTLSTRSNSRMPMSQSASSLSSSSSDFLAESVLHNVRNIFVQNLLSQMAFVVERMSLRSVPASVVNFCGKACAYAFFFCPGVAEILVRLWSPPPDAIRRILKEAGALERSYDNSFAADVLSRNFPAHLQPLAVTSFPSLMRYLRSKPRDNIPLSSAYIPWNGPWVGRWSGRDSDLFFVFTKIAVSLIGDLLPENISQADWVSVPCAALIQAQLLSVMDATIHRGSTQHDQAENLPPPTFDDVLGADAVVQPLPPRAPNTTRIMAENRLVMLLRECLFSPSYSVKPHIRRTFAYIYSNLIKATTRRVSLFDHNACFTLCDFLDETISIISRFHKDETDPAAWMDWPFWFDVLKKMSQSNNTMTEVRLYTFIYGMWGFLTKDEERKRQICLDWLLEESFFERQFNHWCPMVRAYYMRLLCWRLAREDGEASEINILIYETLLTRMRKMFAWFLSTSESARINNAAPPSTAPATPAPGRRLLIVRNDSLLSSGSGGGGGSWDALVSATSSSSQPNTYQRYSSLNPLLQSAEAETKTVSREASPSAKKGWFRKMNPFSSLTTATPTQASNAEADSSPKIGSSDVRPSEASPSDSMSVASKRMSTMSTTSSIMSAASRSRAIPAENVGQRPQATASFKFSLEWVDRASLMPRNRRIYAPQLPHLAQQLLSEPRTDEDGAADEKDSNGSRSRERAKIEPLKPKTSELGLSTYCGRALAEWEGIVREYQGFYERRRVEGVTNVRWIETPTLGVESFRRPVG